MYKAEMVGMSGTKEPLTSPQDRPKPQILKKEIKIMKKTIKVYLYNEYPSNAPNIATEDDIEAQIEDAFKEENNEKVFGYWLNENYSVTDLLHLIPTESLEELQSEFKITLKKNIERIVRNQYFEREIEIEI